MTRDQQRQALSAAAQWVARLAAAPEDPQIHQAWRHWREQSPVHQWAWQRVEMLQGQLQGLPGALAYSTLDKAGERSFGLDRRALLKGLVLAVGVGGIGWTGYRSAPVWLADHRTATGERRHFELADGSRLTLNTASAVDVRFDASQRLLILREGEILVETAKDARPFIVRSAQGDMRALGTRFTVREQDDSTRLGVLEHAVAVRPQALEREQVIAAGQSVSFSRYQLEAVRSLESGEGEWAHGRLLIDGWRLDRLLAELQRYRPGYLGCSADVAGLRLSGAYPLDDTDRALVAVARALPVQVVQRTRYWTRVVGENK